MTAEDAVPLWLVQVLTDTYPSPVGYDVGWLSLRDDGESHEEAHPQATPAHVVKVVCKACNSGWMSRLENEAIPVLGPLVRDEPLRVSVGDQATLAHWAAKTAVTVSQRERGQIEFAQDDLDTIRNGQAPFGYVVRIARRLDALTTPTNHLMAWGSIDRPGRPTGPGFFVTLGLGAVALAVAGGAGIANSEQWTTRPVYPMTIWPPTPGGLRWPPHGPLVRGHDQFVEFHLAMCTRVDGVSTPDATDAIRRRYNADSGTD